MRDKPIQIVLDTNVLVSAFRSQFGSAYRLVSLIGKSRFELNLSVALAFEYESVLKRPEQKISLSHDEIDKLINFLCSVSNLYDIHYLWRPTLSDPNDDFLLELALESQAEYIVTFNSKDFLLAGGRFLKIATPLEFLRAIGDLK
jgi:putative PIN family toxin of toxin-antitoxin system